MDVNGYIDILLIEDNLGDICLITESLKEIGVNLTVYSIRESNEAANFLQKKPPFQDVSGPAIVILDLNLPGKDGRQLLAEIKSDPVTAIVPVIVLSCSDSPHDISDCYALHANCYIVKPRNMPGYIETMRSIVDFWLRRVKLPAPSRHTGSALEDAN